MSAFSGFGPTLRRLRLTATSLIKTACICHLVVEYGFYPALCSGPSMLPTMQVVGEVAWVDKRHRLGRNLAVGDLVSFTTPYSHMTLAAKRIVGLEGDYVLARTPGSGNEEMIQVPKGHCWVTGDNLPDSRDSRHWGPLPLALVAGKIVARGWPFFGFGNFEWFENGLRKPGDED